MSLDNTVEKIDFLIKVVNEANKGDDSTCCSKEETQKISTESACCAHDVHVKYFSSPEQIKSGMNLLVTTDQKLLGKLWDECGLGPMEELESLCGVIGSVEEVEDSDNTVQLRWENYDTAWVPIKACSDAGNSKPTLPGTQTSWLSPDKVENKDNEENNENEPEEQQNDNDNEDESQIKFFVSVEDLQVGDNIRVTKNYDLLEKCWEAATVLEPNDSKYNFLGIEGVVESKDEDNDTVTLRWTSSESVRLPVQACYRAGKKSAF